jgi:hypothetical protein
MLLCSNASAQVSGFGLGIILGEPTGISAKLWKGETTAIDAAAGWSSGKNSVLHLHADYIFHNFNLIDVQKGKLPFYYGIGGRVKFADDTKVGIRIPVGMNYIFAGAPFDIFLELVPLLDLMPDTEFDIKAGLGARYFF